MVYFPWEPLDCFFFDDQWRNLLGVAVQCKLYSQPKQWTLVRRPLCSVDRTLRTCSHCWVRHHQLKESDDILDRGWKNSRILTFLIVSSKSPWSSWILARYNRVYLYALDPYFIPFNCFWCLTFTQIFLVVYMDVFFLPKGICPQNIVFLALVQCQYWDFQSWPLSIDEQQRTSKSGQWWPRSQNAKYESRARPNLIESGHYCRQWAYLAQHPIKTGPFCVPSDS